MMSRRRSFLSLGMILLMLAMPWAAASDSSGRGNEDDAAKVKISTQKQEDQNRVKIEVEFENLTEGVNYDYEITITRVDPDFVHQRYTDNFATESEVDEYTVTEYWTPDQEGPYTVHTTLYQYETVVSTGTDTFGWGDVENNSDPATAEISADPEWTHYDIYGNTSLADNVAIKIERAHTENGASYQLEWEFYEGDDIHDGTLITSEEPAAIQSRTILLSTFNDYLHNNTNYTMASWLWRVNSSDSGGYSNVVVGFQTWTFTIGVDPELTTEPVHEQMRVVLAANQTTGDAPLSVTFFANISEGRTPYEISWEFDDGTFAEDLVTVNHIFHTAGVYNVVLRVTDRDGDMLERGIQIIATEPPVIGNLTGYISHSGQLEPINKDMVASVEFYGTAGGGEGPYTFSWKFGDDSEGNGSTILHEFARRGEFTIELIIEDSAGRTLELEEVITIVKEGGEEGGITPPQEGLDGDESNFDIYATSTGALGLLLIFGMFGRKRRESFLDAERRKAHGEGSMWDQH